MKILAHSSALLFALTLAACGGGGGSSPATTTASGNTPTSSSGTQSSTTTTTTTPPAKTPTTLAASSTTQIVEYYGDSTIWGWDGNSGGAQIQVRTPAPAAFEAKIQAQAPQAKYVVHNEGVSGTSSCQLLDGRDGHQPWPDQMALSSAVYVIINHAINDKISTDPAVRSTIDGYKSCMTQLAQIAQKQGKKVIFETPNPISADGLIDFVNAMKQVAAANGVPIIDQYTNLANLIGSDLSTTIPDGLHPNQDTYLLKGNFAADAFLKMSF